MALLRRTKNPDRSEQSPQKTVRSVVEEEPFGEEAYAEC